MEKSVLPSIALMSAIALGLLVPDAAAQNRKAATPMVPAPSRPVQGGSLLDKPTFGEKFSQEKSGRFFDQIYKRADQAKKINRAQLKRMQAIRAKKKKMVD